MRLKKWLAAVLCVMVMTLAGCGKSVVYKNGIADIKKAHITVAVPHEWTTFTGGDIYEEMYANLPGEFGSVKELKSYYEDSGEDLLLYSLSPNGGVIVLLSGMERGESDAEKTLRAIHDTTIFDLRASGFHTKGEFGGYDWGGVSGVLSSIKVSESESGPEAAEEREFCFERGGTIYSLKMHITSGSEDDASRVELATAE